MKPIMLPWDSQNHWISVGFADFSVSFYRETDGPGSSWKAVSALFLRQPSGWF